MPFARCLAALASADSGQEVAEQLEDALESLRMADAKHRLAHALLRATHGDFRRRDFEKARARAEEALRLAEILERPSEMVMAHVILLESAVLGSDREEPRITARGPSTGEFESCRRSCAKIGGTCIG
jgi:hypothetical protein